MYRPGRYYIGIAETNTSSINADDYLDYFTTNYSLGISTSSCSFFNGVTKEWDTDGCYVRLLLIHDLPTSHLTKKSIGIFRSSTDHPTLHFPNDIFRILCIFLPLKMLLVDKRPKMFSWTALLSCCYVFC